MRQSMEYVANASGPKWHNLEERDAWQRESAKNNPPLVRATQGRLALLIYAETHPDIKLDDHGNLIEPDRKKNHEITLQAVNEFSEDSDDGVNLADSLRAYARQPGLEIPSDLTELKDLLREVRKFAAEKQQRSNAPKETIADIERLGIGLN